MEVNEPYIQSLADDMQDTKLKNSFINMARGVGRPSKYDQKLCYDVLALSMQGKSVKQIVRDLGIGRSTYYEWVNDINKPEFTDTHKKGRDVSEAWWDDLKQNSINDQSYQFLLGESITRRLFNKADDSTVNCPGFSSSKSAEENFDHIIDAIADGNITPNQSAPLRDLVKAKQDAIVQREIEFRLETLEAKVEK